MTSTGREPRDRGHESARRLFFAVWPDDEVKVRLAQVTRQFVPSDKGRPQRPDQWHVTLEFLGEVAEARLPAVFDVGTAASAASSKCEFVLDRVEHWRRPEVLCLTASSMPVPLAGLVETLRSELKLRGFEPESRAFKVHLTLARKLRDAPRLPALEPIRWPADRLSLVQSITDRDGSRYLDLATWPLAG